MAAQIPVRKGPRSSCGYLPAASWRHGRPIWSLLFICSRVGLCSRTCCSYRAAGPGRSERHWRPGRQRLGAGGSRPLPVQTRSEPSGSAGGRVSVLFKPSRRRRERLVTLDGLKTRTFFRHRCRPRFWYQAVELYSTGATLGNLQDKALIGP